MYPDYGQSTRLTKFPNVLIIRIYRRNIFHFCDGYNLAIIFYFRPTANSVTSLVTGGDCSSSLRGYLDSRALIK